MALIGRNRRFGAGGVQIRSRKTKAVSRPAASIAQCAIF
jgi:hypothetical protein